MNRAVKVQGIECPIVREGDNIVDIVVDNVLKECEIDWSSQDEVDAEELDYELPKYKISNKDIIGITESVVARAAGQYITIDDIAADVEKKFGKDATICLYQPIYSRNRFSMILKGIARAAKKIIIVMPEFDEVGNPKGVNPFTGVDIAQYYTNLCKDENCECNIVPSIFELEETIGAINCRLHPSVNDDCFYFKQFKGGIYLLADICSDVSPDWGVLGTNKATEDKLKLFPSKVECQRVCEEVKVKVKEKTGKDAIVCVYGDGCFKDPIVGIWEFADPITMPGYTDKELIESTPNEMKLKSVIDCGYNDEQITGMIDVHKNTNTPHMGTTPRIYRDLLASLMDLTSGSGDRCTPVVLVQNYF